MKRKILLFTLFMAMVCSLPTQAQTETGFQKETENLEPEPIAVSGSQKPLNDDIEKKHLLTDTQNSLLEDSTSLKQGPRKAPANGTLFKIAGGATGLCQDYDGNAMTLPSGIGDMRFTIVSESGKTVRVGTNAVVNTGSNSDIEKINDNTRAIANKDYSGALSIPSRVKYNNVWYDVVNIADYAFYLQNEITSIKIHAKKLNEIGYYAFCVDGKYDSHKSVDIKTSVNLTIDSCAFKQSMITKNDNSPTYEKYKNINRNALETIKIESNGLTVGQHAFLGESLLSVTINSTGLITIKEAAFFGWGAKLSGHPNVVYNYYKPSVFTRDNNSDGVYINGPVKEIGVFAFKGHPNFHTVQIIDPRTDSNTGMIIGSSAFSHCFHGNKNAGSVKIQGPIESIGSYAFSANDAAINNELYHPSMTTKYFSTLNSVEIRNTGTMAMSIGSAAFSDHFFRNTTFSAAGTIKIYGNLSEIGTFAFGIVGNTTSSIQNNRAVRTVIIDNTILSSNNGAQAALATRYNSFDKLLCYSALDTDGSVTVKGSVALLQGFSNNSNLQKVVINNTLLDNKDLWIAPSCFSNSFKRNSEGSVSITGILKTIDKESFLNATYLNKVTISNQSTTSHISIGQSAFKNAFRYASHGSVNISGALSAIKDSAFYEPKNLMTVSINDTQGTSTTMIYSNAFKNGFKRTEGNAGSISIKGRLSSIKKSAFEYPTNVMNVTIENTHSTSLDIGERAFAEGFRRNADGGKISITGGIRYIDKEAFRYPTYVGSVTINNTNSNINLEIKELAFQNGFRYAAHGSVTLTGRIKKIGKQAFENPTNLMTLNINNNLGSTNLIIDSLAFQNGFRRDTGNTGVITIQGALEKIAYRGVAYGNHANAITVKNTGDKSLIIEKQAFPQAFQRAGVSGNISITGKLKTIGEEAFLRNVGCKQLVIDNTSTDTGLTIETKAFRWSFRNDVHGTAEIKGNLLLIDSHAFSANSFEDNKNNLMTVTINNNVGSNHLTINRSAFNRNFNRETGDPGKLTISGKLEYIGDYITHLGKHLMSIEINNTSTNRDLVIDSVSMLECFGRSNVNGTVKITGRLTTIGKQAFSKNTYMNNVTIDNTAGGLLKIGEQAFQDGFRYNASGTLTIKGNMSNVGYRAFYGGTNLMTATMENGTWNLTIEKEAFYNTFSRESATGKLTMTGSLTKIGHSAFRNTKALKTVSITNTGSTQAVIDTMAFYAGIGCKAQTSAREKLFSDGTFTFSGPLKEIGHRAFYDTFGLKTFNLTNDKDMIIKGESFRYAVSLSELNHTYKDTKYTRTVPLTARYIGNNAFEYTAFTEMTIPDLDIRPSYNPNITTSNPMKQATIGFSKVPYSSSSNDTYNVNGCFGDYIFQNCRNLKKVTINSTTTGGRAAFKDCTALADVTLGTKVKMIEQYAFEGCTSLNELFVPSSVQVIADGIMYKGASPHRITFESAQPPHATKSAFNGNNPNIVVPKGCVSAYMFSGDDLGFQNVKNDNISCEYTMSSSGWGTLGMISHSTKEYKATLESGRLQTLTMTDTRGTFTDVYDIRRIGTEDSKGLATDVAPSSEIKVYTADYYYPKKGEVGLDKININAIVPQNTSTTNRNIGYLVNGEPGKTYYLHHYTGGAMASTAKANGYTYTTAGYTNLSNAAKAVFDSEDIPCPQAFGAAEYSRTDAPNLLIAWKGTSYRQGEILIIDDGRFHGRQKCYFYGMAGGKFRKISGWSQFKEGNAFLAIPTYLMDATNGAANGKEVLDILIVNDNDHVSDSNTTGVEEIIDNNMENIDDVWYTLSGVRLNKKPTHSGIYIHNGRKEVIR